MELLKKLANNMMGQTPPAGSEDDANNPVDPNAEGSTPSPDPDAMPGFKGEGPNFLDWQRYQLMLSFLYGGADMGDSLDHKGPGFQASAAHNWLYDKGHVSVKLPVVTVNHQQFARDLSDVGAGESTFQQTGFTLGAGVSYYVNQYFGFGLDAGVGAAYFSAPESPRNNCFEDEGEEICFSDGSQGAVLAGSPQKMPLDDASFLVAAAANAEVMGAFSVFLQAAYMPGLNPTQEFTDGGEQPLSLNPWKVNFGVGVDAIGVAELIVGTDDGDSDENGSVRNPANPTDLPPEEVARNYLNQFFNEFGRNVAAAKAAYESQETIQKKMKRKIDAISETDPNRKEKSPRIVTDGLKELRQADAEVQLNYNEAKSNLGSIKSFLVSYEGEDKEAQQDKLEEAELELDTLYGEVAKPSSDKVTALYNGYRQGVEAGDVPPEMAQEVEEPSVAPKPPEGYTGDPVARFEKQEGKFDEKAEEYKNFLASEEGPRSVLDTALENQKENRNYLNKDLSFAFRRKAKELKSLEEQLADDPDNSRLENDVSSLRGDLEGTKANILGSIDVIVSAHQDVEKSFKSAEEKLAELSALVEQMPDKEELPEKKDEIRRVKTELRDLERKLNSLKRDRDRSKSFVSFAEGKQNELKNTLEGTSLALD